MKLTIIWTVLYPILFLFETTSFKIEGTQFSCNTNKYDSRERYIQLKKNDLVIRKNIKTSSGEFTIPKLNAGKYILEYKNIFGQVCSQEVVLQKNKKVKVRLCTDNFIDTKEITYFSSISSQDTLFLKFNSSGCFHSRKETMKFYKKNNNTIAQLVNDQEIVTETILDENEKESTTLFFRKVQNIGNGMGGCTTGETYILRMNGYRDFAVVDQTCDWRGFDELKAQIFRK